VHNALNLGCFTDVISHPDWLNIDILPIENMLPKGTNFLRADLGNGLPTFEPQSVGLIRMSHLIEHVTLEQARFLLKDCYRLLRPGGVIRIATPDAKLIIAHYPDDMVFFDKIQPPEYVNAATAGEKLSRLLYSGDYAHKALYDVDMMYEFLHEAGEWNEIRQQASNVSFNPEMLRLPDQHVEISMFVEAVR
jgi:predicted SAM-dependent methyltransferase